MKKRYLCIALTLLTLITVSEPCSAATLRFPKIYPKKPNITIPKLPRLPKLPSFPSTSKSYNSNPKVQEEYEKTIANNDFILEHIDRDFENCVNIGDKAGCQTCESRYATAVGILVEYAEKYYNKDLVNKIFNAISETEGKLEKLYGGVNTPYQSDGTTIDVMRQRGNLYKELCHELEKIKKEQEYKLDESEITVGHVEEYSEETQTGFKDIGNNEYRYYENGRMLNNEWKEFDDGYRYFNPNGTMAHDDIVCGLDVNGNGIVTFIDGTQKDKYYPIINQSISTDLKFISHTFRVFDIPMNVEYINTFTKEKDGLVYSCNIDFQDFGFGNYEDQDATAEIQVYKYADRLNFNN